jgi:diaminopimelate decarboxylase
MGGQTPFGMTEHEALDLLRRSADCQPVEGFHGYLGTQILDSEVIIGNTALLLEIASGLQARSGARFRFVDLGGGFGVPMSNQDKRLNCDHLKRGLRALVEEFRLKHPWTETVAFESGRFLSARAGVFVCTVIDCKERGGELFVVLDGGVSSIGGRDGYAGARPTPMRLLADSGEVVSATFCGPLCTPMDRLATRVAVRRPKPGQIVAFYLAGAYAYSASPGMFLSHGYAAEVGVSLGKARLLRPRQDLSAMLNSQATFRAEPE